MKIDDLDGIKRILVYKRTHNGDPNENGEFGCNDCMGTVRDWDFDAVIGVGGISASRYKMDGKITWIGIHPLESEQQVAARMIRRKQTHPDRMVLSAGKKKISTARVVTFEHFIAFQECGYFPPSERSARMFVNAPDAPRLKTYAPTLAKKLLRNLRAPRMLDENDDVEFAEAKSILILASTAPPSPRMLGVSARLEGKSCAPVKGNGARPPCKTRNGP